MLSKLIQLISPSCCTICNKEGGILCPTCTAEQLKTKKPACFYCNTLTADGRTCSRCRPKVELNGVAVLYRFQPPVDQLVYRLKYSAEREVAEFFGSQLFSILPDRIGRQCVVSFVPIDGPSLRRRSYNQAQLLAKSFCRSSDLGPSAPKLQPSVLLLRTKHHGQVGLNRQQRFEAIADNFVAVQQLNGQAVVLVDDVLTTGATLNECARVLKSAGAGQVWGLVVAKR